MKNKSFLKILLPFLLYPAISLAVMLFIYNLTIKAIINHTHENSITVLNQNKNIIDAYLRDIENVSHAMRYDSILSELESVPYPYEGRNTYKVYQAIRQVNNFEPSNYMMQSFQIIYKSNDLVLYSKSATGAHAPYSQTVFDEMGIDDWESLLFGRYHYNTVLPEISSDNGNIVTFITTLSQFPFNNRTFVAYVDADKIRQLLSGVNISGEGAVYILDENNSVITSTKDLFFDTDLLSDYNVRKININGQPYLLTGTRSDYNNWRYIALHPYGPLMSKVNSIRNTIVLSLFTYFIVGVFISLLFAKNKWTIKSEKERFQTGYEEQKPYVELLFIERLLNHFYTDTDDCEQILSQTEIDLNGDYYTVVIIQDLGGLETGGGSSEMIQSVGEMARQVLCGIHKIYTHFHSSSQIILILVSEGLSENTKAYLQTALPDLYNQIANAYNMETAIAVGSFCKSILNISKSYKDARNVIENINWRGYGKQERIGWFDAFTTQEFSIDFYDEDILIKVVKSGNAETLKQQYDEFNKLSYNLSYSLNKLYLSNLWCCLFKTAGGILTSGCEENNAMLQVKNDIVNLNLNLDLPQLRDTIWNLFFILCDYYASKRKANRIIPSILRFIEENYANKDFCLTYVSDAFHISSAHLSRLFKDETDTSFMEYVQRLRIEKAQELLRDTELSVQDISESVGYNSINSFSRAFKRINNVSATDFRKMSDM